MIKIVIEFMFLGINIFWTLLNTHFNPHPTARAKMSLSRAQNTFIPKNINTSLLSYCENEGNGYLLILQMMEQHRSLIRHCYSMWKPTQRKNHLCQTMNTANFSPTYQQHLRITCRRGRTNGAHSLTVALFPFGFPVQIFGIAYKRMTKAIISLICLTPITT